jgi:flagellar hook assembly protein FlgD
VLVYSVSGVKSGKNESFMDLQGSQGWDGTNLQGKKVDIGNYKVVAIGAIDDTYENGFFDFDGFEVDIEGFIRNSDRLTININKNEFFVKEDSVPVTYSVDPRLNQYKVRIEILASDQNASEGIQKFSKKVNNGQNLQFKMGTINGWNGRDNAGDFVEVGYYLVRVIASPDTTFSKGYTDFELIEAQKRQFTALIVNEDSITESSTQAVEFGTAYVGNVTDAACNICTRAAVYLSTGKGDTLLYPIEGSYIGNDQSLYLKGLITNPGKANDIYDKLLIGSITRLMHIPDMIGEDYPDFEELQDNVNDGQIIVGTLRNNSGSGHVVMIVPGTAARHATNPSNYKYNGNKAEIKFPKILECGSDHRESATPVYDNIPINKLKQMRWYRLIVQ